MKRVGPHSQSCNAFKNYQVTASALFVIVTSIILWYCKRSSASQQFVSSVYCSSVSEFSGTHKLAIHIPMSWFPFPMPLPLEARNHLPSQWAFLFPCTPLILSYYYFAAGDDGMSVWSYICMIYTRVCMSLRALTYLKTAPPNFTKFSVRQDTMFQSFFSSP